MNDLLLELGVILVSAAVFGYLAKRFKQPPILGYIAAGVLVGQMVFGHSTGITLGLFSQMGVAFLLFMLGLELNITELKEVGPVSLAVGIGQVVVTSTVGFFFAQLVFGFGLVESAYIAVGLTFSSTIIIVKLLGEKGDLNSLYGRISVGMLIVQDLIAIIALIALTSLSTVVVGDWGWAVVRILVSGGLLLGLAFIWGRLIGVVLASVGKSSELVMLIGISWALLFANLTHWLGFSIEVGAFLAGVALATSSTSVEMAAKIKPLRDFFIVLFFVGLGMGFNLSGIGTVIGPVLLFSLLVVVGNPLILLIIMGLMGYHRRIGFLTGLTVSQISEFSLILIGTGVALGQVQENTLVIVTGVAVVTLILSSYLISHGERLYELFANPLKVFQRGNLRFGEVKISDGAEWVLLIGAHRMGQVILSACRDKGLKTIVVDYDPAVVRQLQSQGAEAIYGDLSDPELLGQVDLAGAVAIISTVPSLEDNLFMLEQLSSLPGDFVRIVRAKDNQEATELRSFGADFALVPEHEAGERVVALLIENAILETLPE